MSPADPIIAQEVEHCPVCHGRGIRFIQQPRGQGDARQRARICSCVENVCLCGGEPPYRVYSQKKDMMLPCYCRDYRLKLSQLTRKYNQADIPPRYQWKFLEHFRMDWTNINNAETQLFALLDWAEHFVQNYPNPDVDLRGLSLFGPTGVGKTLICCVILNELLLRYGANVRYAKTSHDFLNAIQATFSRNSESYGRGNTILRSLQMAEVLVLDDFGIQKESEWSDRIIYDLIDHRYENNRLTLITSNKRPEDFRHLASGRIFSRLQEMTQFIVLDIPDYRSQKRAGG